MGPTLIFWCDQRFFLDCKPNRNEFGIFLGEDQERNEYRTYAQIKRCKSPQNDIKEIVAISGTMKNRAEDGFHIFFRAELLGGAAMA